MLLEVLLKEFKLESIELYKEILNSGYVLSFEKELLINGNYVGITLFKNDFYGYNISGLAHDTYVLDIHDKEWNNFKDKVKKIFSEVK